MDSSAAKTKQKPISAFFGASAKKECNGPRSTQAKISTFFGGGAKTPSGPGAKTPGNITATLKADGNATPAGRPDADQDATNGAATGPNQEAPAQPPCSVGAKTVGTAPKTAVKAPAGGSTSKPKPSAGAKAGKAKAPGRGKDKPAAEKSKKAAGGAKKRLRRVVLEDEEEGVDAAAGLEDEVEDEKQMDDSDYENGASGGDSDEDFSAEEEEEDDGAEEEASDDEGDHVGVGSKRKRAPSKAAASAKRTPAGAKAKSSAAAMSTPGGDRTPAAVSGRLRPDATPTPHGTVSKGPASATAGGGAGRSCAAALATPATGTTAVGPYGTAGRSRQSSGGAGTVGGATPSSVRSVRSALSEDTPSKSQGAGDVTLGVAACTDGDAARFADRMASRFPFLHPDAIRDAEKRRPDHPDYDPRTVFIPPTWFKEAKISEGQQQWWNFKAHNFDSVLLFKMGKFYEMFEMDAYVGVDVLGLSFMKGEQPHAGFPEVKYADMAEGLARAGYRVVVIEQTETPEMLARRNEQRKREGKKLCNVVDRQKVAVLSRGTLTDAEMVASRPDAAYVLAVAEAPLENCDAAEEGGSSAGGIRIGLCAVDAASGQILLGEFADDEVRSALRTQLTALQPQELVLPRQSLSATTSHVLRNGVRDPRVNVMRGTAGDWSAEKTYRTLRNNQYFTASTANADGGEEDEAAGAGGDAMDVDGGSGKAATAAGQSSGPGAPPPPELDASQRWPELLRNMVADGVASRPAAMAALGGVIAFLRDCLLDRAVLPLGRFEELPALAPNQQTPGADGEGAGADGEAGGPLYLALNGAALENLEILENSDGGSAGTLLSVLDHCTTPFGRRRLRQWLCRPLGRIRDITARQDAVAALAGGLAEAAGQARKLLAGVSDLERAISRLHASTVDGALGREAAHVVLYEDAGRRRVAALSGALKDLRAAHAALGKLRAAMQAAGGDGGSELLRQIVTERCRPAEVSSALEALEGATDWKEAAQTGRAVPEPGVDEQYDAMVADVDAANGRLQDYLKEVRQRLNCREVCWVSVNKDSHLLEVPEAAAGRIKSEFELVGNRKGYKRYTSTKLRQLVAEYDKEVERREQVLSGILTRLVVRFVQHRSLWVGLVDAVAEADALFSLAAHAMSPPDGGPMCRPRLVRPPRTGNGNGACGAILEAVALRHPAGIGGRNNGAFVPNDVCMGGRLRPGAEGGEQEEQVEAAPPFVLLSGPNMGGKSTLLRQVCLATVLAQVGACVPAESLTLSPVDALFVRMGARDSIMTGQSTFFIELAETAAMLARATPHSLVALDELGRGTATLDGAAVAGAVLSHLAAGTGCRGLFATHYHHLSDEHAADPRVAVMHMACAVEGAEQDGERPAADSAAAGSEEVTFLYRLTPGACPKSYGTNVARLAGLPPHVVERAAEVSARWDRGQAQQQQPEGGEGPDRPREQRAEGGQQAMEVDGEGAAAGNAGDGSGAVAAAAEFRALAKQLRAVLGRAGQTEAPEEEAQLTRLRELQAAAARLLGA